MGPKLCVTGFLWVCMKQASKIMQQRPMILLYARYIISTDLKSSINGPLSSFGVYSGSFSLSQQGR